MATGSNKGSISLGASRIPLMKKENCSEGDVNETSCSLAKCISILVYVVDFSQHSIYAVAVINSVHLTFMIVPFFSLSSILPGHFASHVRTHGVYIECSGRLIAGIDWPPNAFVEWCTSQTCSSHTCNMWKPMRWCVRLAICSIFVPFSIHFACARAASIKHSRGISGNECFPSARSFDRSGHGNLIKTHFDCISFFFPHHKLSSQCHLWLLLLLLLPTFFFFY